MKTLIVYTGRIRTAPPGVRRHDLFCYPFANITSRTAHKLDFFNFQLKCESITEVVESSTRFSNDELRSGFSFVSDERALQIELAARNQARKKIYLLWSGGIDSSVALISLCKNLTPAMKENLTVVLSLQSISENPNLYHSVVSKLNVRNYFEAWPKILKESDALIVTGELGDQIMGSGMLLSSYKRYGPEFLKTGYEKNAATVIRDYLKGDTHRSEFDHDLLFEYIRPIANECPVPLRTVFDFFWWFNFSQEWQFAKLKFLERPEIPTHQASKENILHFFDSLPFQHWSISTLGRRSPSSWIEYKKPAKEYIAAFAGRASIDTLIKRQSLKHTYFVQRFRLGVGEGHESVDTIEGLSEYCRNA